MIFLLLDCLVYYYNVRWKVWYPSYCFFTGQSGISLGRDHVQALVLTVCSVKLDFATVHFSYLEHFKGCGFVNSSVTY